jgi:recombinational DNA repair protein RecR
MTGLIPQLCLVTTGVAALMIRLGVARGLLQLRKAPRRCPSCGRLIDGRVCATCTRPTGRSKNKEA